MQNSMLIINEAKPRQNLFRVSRWLLRSPFRIKGSIATGLIGLCLTTSNALAQTTAFTYQGRLNVSGGPANGNYDFIFQVFDAASGGGNIGGLLTTNGVAVSNGIFTVTLDFGGTPFTGPARWLDVAVRTNGAGSHTILAPRQPLMTTPYAIYANTAGTVTNGAIGNAQLTANAIAGGNIQNSAITSGKIAAGQVVKNLNGLTDSVVLAQGVNITITTNGNILQFSAPAGGLALPYSGSSAGSPVFSVSNSSSGTAISGLSSGSGGRGIFGFGDYGVYGQSDNAGGRGVAGVANSSATDSIGVYGLALFGAGVGVYGHGGDYGVRGHAPNNGGRGVLGTSAAMNSIAIRGLHQATGNEGQLGRQDSGVQGYHSSGNYGYVGTSDFGVCGLANANFKSGVAGTNSLTGVYGELGKSALSGEFGFASGVYGYGIGGLNLAGYFDGDVRVIGNITCTSLSQTSDRNAKENMTKVSPQTVLEKVAALPITQWNFKKEKGVLHVGPMAQDFYAAFGLGMDDKHIATVDVDGVALAAIQGLNQKLEDKNIEIRELKQRLERLEKFINTTNGGVK